ncbi:MAG: polysaccharide deacetylase [Ruminococcaceae bacterium]|nr:polysaccharide deacetylase [Oscillospiraceae bacterium]
MKSIFMRFPGGKSKALTLSYDDGVRQDKRLIEIMQKYGLKGTFNINSECYDPEGCTTGGRMTRSEALALYRDSGMEVAVHGAHHPFLEQLPENLCTLEILNDRKNLEADFGGFIRGMAYPMGTTSDSVVASLKQCGIAYARTVVSTENFDIPTDWLRLPATCHHNNPRLMELAELFLRPWDVPMLFYLWGHSYEFDENNNWSIIEKFAEYMGGREEVWYATNIEIYDYITAYCLLPYSCTSCTCVPDGGIRFCFHNNQRYIPHIPSRRGSGCP